MRVEFSSKLSNVELADSITIARIIIEDLSNESNLNVRFAGTGLKLDIQGLESFKKENL